MTVNYVTAVVSMLAFLLTVQQTLPSLWYDDGDRYDPAHAPVPLWLATFMCGLLGATIGGGGGFRW
jgi:hypothetical protein